MLAAITVSLQSKISTPPPDPQRHITAHGSHTRCCQTGRSLQRTPTDEEEGSLAGVGHILGHATPEELRHLALAMVPHDHQSRLQLLSLLTHDVAQALCVDLGLRQRKKGTGMCQGSLIETSEGVVVCASWRVRLSHGRETSHGDCGTVTSMCVSCTQATPEGSGGHAVGW